MASAATSKKSIQSSDLSIVDGGVEVKLGGKTRRLTWSNAAMFRVSAKGFQTWDPEKSVACVVVYVWAMLDNHADIEPDDVAELLPLGDKEEMSNLGKAITKAIELGNGAKK